MNQDKQGTFNIGIQWNWCIYTERFKISSIPKGFRLEFMRGVGQKYNFHENILSTNDSWCHNIEWFGEGQDKKNETTKVKCFQHFHSSFYLVKWCLSFIQLGSKNSIQCCMLLRVLTNVHLCMFFMNIFVLHNVFQNPQSAAVLRGLVQVHQTMGQREMLLKMRLRFCHLLLMLR